MFSALTAVVFPTAIIVCFSKEFNRLIKKIFSVPGMKVVLPLLIATLVVFHYQPILHSGLLILKLSLDIGIMWLSNGFTFSGKQILISIGLLMILTCLCLALVEKRKKQRPYLNYQSAWVFPFFIWSLVTVLLSTPA